MSIETYAVEGMTCDHCVAAVAAEVQKIPGITDVVVDLGTGTVTVTGDASRAAVAAAVDEAGYTLG